MQSTECCSSRLHPVVAEDGTDRGLKYPSGNAGQDHGQLQLLGPWSVYYASVSSSNPYNKHCADGSVFC